MPIPTDPPRTHDEQSTDPRDRCEQCRDPGLDPKYPLLASPAMADSERLARSRDRRRAGGEAPGIGTDQPARPSELAGARPLQRRSLPQEVSEQMLELIASADAAEVALPSERRLCEQFGVGRNVLREALSALEGRGVTRVQGKVRIGNSARARAQLLARAPATAERALALDPIEARRIMEPEIAALAAERAGKDEIEEITGWLMQMEQAHARGERVVEFDSAFHVAIARASENHTLVQVVAALTEALRDSRELSFQPEPAGRAAIEGHRAILDALRAKDPRAARRAMRKHLDRVEQLIRASLANSEHA
jgi:GntR family transcriptional regulator, transcriptional repressor for pyruvate dehydrogenase complex